MSQEQPIHPADATEDHLHLVEWYFQQGWTDGLPVVPPTPETVTATVDALGGDRRAEGTAGGADDGVLGHAR